jgi:ABC-type transport system substrate-binding protein
MIDFDFQHIKKKVFLWVSITLWILIIHLIGVYIFEGGKFVGLPGGSISIGLVSETPNARNPLSYGKTPEWDLLFNFMFQSMLKYNTEHEIFEWNLGQCNIEDLSRVSCTIKENIRWSDGTPIQISDFISTYRAFKENVSDWRMASFLNEVTIKAEKWKILFSSKTKNPLMLDFLTYPIIRSDVIDQIKTGRLWSGTFVSSGPFIFTEEAQDKEYWFTRITLSKNKEFDGENIWLDKVHFKFFGSLASLERSTDALSIVIPPTKVENLQLGWRFEKYKYTSNEFFSVFFHTDRLTRSIRNLLHWQIGNAFSGKILENHKEVQSIFTNNETTLPREWIQNFPDMLRKEGFFRKNELISLIEGQGTIWTGQIIYDTARYIKTKERRLELFLDEKTNDIRLSWVPAVNAEKITVNGYALQEFRKGNKDFFYRISEERNNLKNWKNLYAFEFFGANGKRIALETLTVYKAQSVEELAEYKKLVDELYIAKKNTKELIALREEEKRKSLSQIQSLDERYYYNKNGEPFSIKVNYVNGRESTENYAKIIEKTLVDLSVKTNIEALTPEDVGNIIKTGKKDYDILIIWIESPGSLSRIGQTFLSTEVPKWVNFANIQSKNLDELFANFRSTTDTGSVNLLEEKITKIMQKESFFLPIASPYHVFYNDRNLKGIRQIDRVPSISSLSQVLEHVSIKDAYVINTDWKGIWNFFSWLFKKAFFL